MKCAVCGKEIKEKYFKANVDRELKLIEKGDVVCSMECTKEYEDRLPHGGKALQHWSRITGYYQNISGWNAGKLQELKDRQRYGVGGNE